MRCSLLWAWSLTLIAHPSPAADDLPAAPSLLERFDLADADQLGDAVKQTMRRTAQPPSDPAQLRGLRADLATLLAAVDEAPSLSPAVRKRYHKNLSQALAKVDKHLQRLDPNDGAQRPGGPSPDALGSRNSSSPGKSPADRVQRRGGPYGWRQARQWQGQGRTPDGGNWQAWQYEEQWGAGEDSAAKPQPPSRSKSQNQPRSAPPRGTPADPLSYLFPSTPPQSAFTYPGYSDPYSYPLTGAMGYAASSGFSRSYRGGSSSGGIVSRGPCR